jgi:predicted O-methyltransferase YrrM
MYDTSKLRPPDIVGQLIHETAAAGFELASEPLVGSWLRTLAASRPAGRFLELGTGTGIATAWILDGMDNQSSLISIESDKAVLAVAQRHLSVDPRVRFRCEDAADVIPSLPTKSFDMIFADSWAGKFTHLEETLALLGRGGLYVIDDMLPHPAWPADHARKVESLLVRLQSLPDLLVTLLDCSSGIVVAVTRQTA